jgi:putative restriction endonuclease
MKRNNWSREELIIAFNLYCKIPFAQLNARNKKVVEIALLIGRTANAVALKLVNFASLDPFHQQRGVKGMQNSGKMDKVIYDEFVSDWENLIYESELLLEKYNTGDKLGIEDIKKVIQTKEHTKEGRDTLRLVKTRVNQSFFRTMVLANYNSKCAVSRIDLPELLVASHIIPWAENEKERLNPENGICLSPLYDKLFDEGLMTLTNNFQIIFSEKILRISNKSVYENFFKKYENQNIMLPEKFLPQHEFLTFHRENIFEKWNKKQN